VTTKDTVSHGFVSNLLTEEPAEDAPDQLSYEPTCDSLADSTPHGGVNVSENLCGAIQHGAYLTDCHALLPAAASQVVFQKLGETGGARLC